MTGRPPPRERITSPRTSAAPASRLGARGDLDEQTRVGIVLISSLKRAQLRLALVIGAFLAALLGGIPLLFLVFPHLGHDRVGGAPVGWLLLAIGVFPVICGAAWWYVRAAERREDEFTELVDRS